MWAVSITGGELRSLSCRRPLDAGHVPADPLYGFVHPSFRRPEMKT
jgi:hypothetical protein